MHAMRAKRLPADERRQEIIEWAFRLLAQKGFEGLRMRDIARHVGINSATIHYYFATKQDLIGGVAQHLAVLFSAYRAPTLDFNAAVPGPLRDLRQEFADAAFYRAEYPDFLLVSRELMLRAQRDPDVSAVIAPLNDQWCAALERIIARGQSERVFRGDLAATAMSRVIVAALWGMSALLQLSPRKFAEACQAIEDSLLAPKPLQDPRSSKKGMNLI
jgi:AcrR family transcriptional regulator